MGYEEWGGADGAVIGARVPSGRIAQLRTIITQSVNQWYRKAKEPDPAVLFSRCET
jgi:hypothetical protein